VLDRSTNAPMLTRVVAIFPWENIFFVFFSFFLLKGERPTPVHFHWNSNIDKGNITYFHWNNIGYTKKIKEGKYIISIPYLNLLRGGEKSKQNMLITS